MLVLILKVIRERVTKMKRLERSLKRRTEHEEIRKVRIKRIQEAPIVFFFFFCARTAGQNCNAELA
jgi:hypothetical protein